MKNKEEKLLYKGIRLLYKIKLEGSKAGEKQELSLVPHPYDPSFLQSSCKAWQEQSRDWKGKNE